MTNKPENPPAFPQSLSADGPFGGMTLRDWFAGQALAGLITGLGSEALTPNAAAITATEAFSLADAMLAERSKDNRHGQ